MYSNFSDNRQHKKQSGNTEIYARSVEDVGSARKNRNDSYKDCVNRKLFERGQNFNTDSRFDKYTDPKKNTNRGTKFSDVSNFGEITGEMLDIPEIDQGMPLRFNVTTIVPEKINYDNKYNPRLDFELYESKPNIDVSYFDPNQIINNNSGFADINYDNYDNNNNTPNFATVTNSFTFSLRELLDKNESHISSPYSVMELLNILYSGSAGSTERELRQLFSSFNKQNTMQSIKKINKQINYSQSCKIKNLVLFRQASRINTAFLDYISDLATVDKFNASKPVREANRINDYITRETAGSVTDLVKSEFITKDSCLILVNTVNFYSRWKTPFQKKDTRAELFHGIRSPGAVRNVMMMQQVKTKHSYMEDEQYQFLEISYHDPAFVFGILLPKNNNSTLNINSEQFAYYISNMQELEINTVKIPKFKHKSKFNLVPTLQKLGLCDIFIKADLPDIINNSNADVRVSKVVQHATIIVDEAGTKASAATAIMCVDQCAVMSSKKKINFIANHPFIYYIRHKQSNTVLFIGKYC